MATFITGDYNNFNDVEDFVIKTSLTYTLIMLGDTALSDAYAKEKLSKLPITLFFLCSNNERHLETVTSFDKVERFGGKCYVEQKYPNILYAKDGEIYNFNGRKCLTIGEISEKNKLYKIQTRIKHSLNRVNWKVDAVFSYAYPKKYIPNEQISQDSIDKSMKVWLDDIENNLDYDKWFCGQFNVDKQVDNLVFFHKKIYELFRFPIEFY